MSVITRKFSACPVRTSTNTWNTIVNVIAGTNTNVNNDLSSITGIASSIISDGTPENNPITIIGSGPRLRIYCLYDEDGSTEDANEATLNWNLFEKDWEIYLPVEKEDLDWVKKALSEKGKKFKAYEAGTEISDEDSEDVTAQINQELTIDIAKLKSNG